MHRIQLVVQPCSADVEADVKQDSAGVAVIGLSYGEGECATIANTPGLDLRVVCSRTRRSGEAIARRHGADWTDDFRSAVARPDVDVVCDFTPSPLHREVSGHALAHGRHVLTSKPVATTLRDAEELVDLADEHEVVLAVDFHLRYQPALRWLFDEIQADRVGRVHHGDYALKCHRTQEYYDRDDGWRGGPTVRGGGVVLNQGIHLLDLACWLQGPATNVVAAGGAFTHDIEADDTVAAVVTFASGSIGSVIATTSFHNDGPPTRYGGGTRQRIELAGSDGSATIEDGRVRMRAGAVSNDPPGPADARTIYDDLVATMAGGPPSPSFATGNSALAGMRLARALVDAAQGRNPVRVD